MVDLSQKKAITYPNGKNNGLQSETTLGSEWFHGFENLTNVRFIVQFGFARNQGHNYADAVRYVQTAIRSMGGCDSPKLHAVELGNEPNLYAGQHARPKNYGVEDYIAESKKFMDVLEKGITCLRGKKIFQVYQRSSKLHHPSWSM